MIERKPINPDRTTTLITALEQWFDDCPSCVVAFSGGIDSSLVAFLARKYLGRENCLAVVGNSASLKERDLQAARLFATQYDIPLRVVATQELSTPGYRANTEDRCFHCKSVLFTQLEAVRREMGFAHILGGENLDDHSDYRPGLKAAKNFKVRGPLAECSVTKDEVRKIEAGENLLEARGFPVSRVRHHGDFARIDPEGFVSGKMNRVL